jgi:hypothetical protein
MDKIVNFYKGHGERTGKNNIGCYVYKVKWFITALREDGKTNGLWSRFKNENGIFIEIPIKTLFSGSFKECKKYLLNNGTEEIKKQIKNINSKNEQNYFYDLYKF